MSKAMLKLVCWLYFQVLAVLYFLPRFQVTFWEGAQTMRKSTKHANLDDIHEVWLSNAQQTWVNHSWASIGLFCCSIRFQKCWAQVGKTARKPINFFNAICTLLFCFGIQLTIQNPEKTKNNKAVEVHDWLRHRVVFCLVWMPKQKSKCKQH